MRAIVKTVDKNGKGSLGTEANSKVSGANMADKIEPIDLVGIH